MWANFREAPTVVDLKAWEVRARVAAEEERERRAKAAETEVAESEAADDAEAEAVNAGPPAERTKSSGRIRKRRSRRGA